MNADADRWIAAPGLTVVDRDGGSVVYEPATATLHHLEPMTAAVLACCHDAISTAQLTADLVDAGCGTDVAAALVGDALAALGRAGLVSAAVRP
jgi:PqqD family protein of HPr-rel-A system